MALFLILFASFTMLPEWSLAAPPEEIFRYLFSTEAQEKMARNPAYLLFRRHVREFRFE